MLNRRGNCRNFVEADRLPILALGRSIKNFVSALKWAKLWLLQECCLVGIGLTCSLSTGQETTLMASADFLAAQTRRAISITFSFPAQPLLTPEPVWFQCGATSWSANQLYCPLSDTTPSQRRDCSCSSSLTPPASPLSSWTARRILTSWSTASTSPGHGASPLTLPEVNYCSRWIWDNSSQS